MNLRVIKHNLRLRCQILPEQAITIFTIAKNFIRINMFFINHGQCRNLNTFVESIFLLFFELFVVDDNKLFSEWKYTAGVAAVALLATMEDEEVARR